MFDVFESKNKKLVKRWKKEHEHLVILANKVLSAYVKGEESETRRQLKKFVDLAMEHLSDEDIELYRILRDPSRKDQTTEKYVDQYYKSFKDTKSTLMQFLSKYVRPETPLDEEFFKTFEQIAGILRERIDYEEQNLYFWLNFG